jgi:hypothetical protein
MTMFTREGLVDMLRHNIVTVTFTKVNGDERVMKCTLRSEMIPNAPTQNGELVVEQKQSSNNVSVWDVDSQGWRSFRVASVKSISVG